MGLQGELDGLMMQHPHLVHPKQHIYAAQRQQYQNQPPNMNMSSEQLPHRYHQANQPNEQMSPHLMHPSSGPMGPVGVTGPNHPALSQYGMQQKSFSSSEEELRYASEMNGELIGKLAIFLLQLK